MDIFNKAQKKTVESWFNQRAENLTDRAGTLFNQRLGQITRPFGNLYEDFFGEGIPGQFGKPSAPEKEADRLARIQKEKNREKEKDIGKFPKGGKSGKGSISPLSRLASTLDMSVARTNRFEVLINTPKSVRGLLETTGRSSLDPHSKKMLEHLMYTCETASLPGRGLATVENKTYGPLRKHPYAQIYTDITLTFLLNNEYLAKRYFEMWQQSIYDISSHNMNYYDEYITPIQIFQLSVGSRNKPGLPTRALRGDAWDPHVYQEEILYGVELQEAYPVTIGDLTFNSGDENAYHRLPVTFAFRTWREFALPLSLTEGSVKVYDLIEVPEDDQGWTDHGH